MIGILSIQRKQAGQRLAEAAPLMPMERTPGILRVKPVGNTQPLPRPAQ
jgi:hypothetical protein